MPSSSICLWFNGTADTALEFYGSLFPDMKVTSSTPGPDGSMSMGDFEMLGHRFRFLNFPADFELNDAVSVTIECDGQAEVDHYWDAFIAAGGEANRCGWLTDAFGLSWQIYPANIGDYVGGSDPEGAQRATAAMLEMQKIDLPTLERAYAGR